MPKPRLLDARLPTLYLDYDGVLHPENVYRDRKTGKPTLSCPEYPSASLFMWATPLLHRVQDRSLQIVLSTSWVPVLSFDRALAYLPEQLQAFVAGSTYHRRRFTRDEWFQHHRYQQIAQHVQRHHIAEWLALDDDVDGWPDTARHRLAECDGVHGVSRQWSALDTWLDKIVPLPTATPAP